jgi:hypothetical protein
MLRFMNGQRVQINNPSPDHNRIEGWVGTVARLRKTDDAAWVKMARDLPRNLQSFPADDDWHRHIILWPDECKPVEPATRP